MAQEALPFIEGQISYLNSVELYKTEKPFISSVPFLVSEGKNSNIDESKHNVKIFDVRGHEDSFRLGTHGFQYVTHEFVAKPERKIDGPGHPYINEVTNLLKNILHPKAVVVYDCNVRRIGDLDFFQPATSAHIDHTPRNALFRFQEAMKLYGEVEFDRWQAYTVWCPLSHPVMDWPLAVCDFRSVDAEEDLEMVDTVLPHRVNEIYHLRHNKAHRWYYLSDQKPSEALIMKIHDSKDTDSRFCAHASFRAPTFDARMPRESIDVRTFVMY